MASPFAFAGTLQIPSDPSLPPDGIPVNMQGQFSSENTQILNLTGSGSKTVPFGTIGSAGLNGLLIRVDPNATSQPINVTVNGGSMPIEISPGGFLSFGSPNPATGITSISIAYTSNNVVRIWALGP
jgi:hypothetical protein